MTTKISKKEMNKLARKAAKYDAKEHVNNNSITFRKVWY